MARRQVSSSTQQGFSLIELLIVVAIIGVIAAMLVPNLMDAMQKTKQRATQGDLKAVGTAWMSWVTDQVSAGAAGLTAQQLDWQADLSNAVSHAQLATLLEGDGDQFYMLKVPAVDGWGNPLDFRGSFDPGDASSFRGLLTSSRAIGLRSLGRDGEAEGNVYTNGSFPTTNYDGDIVWSDGYFVRGPGSLSAASEPEGGGKID